MPNLSYNKQYSDPVAPTSEQLDAAFDSIALFFNVTGVGGDNIQDNSLGTAVFADNVTTETKILNANVTEPKIADASVTPQKLSTALRNALTPPATIRPYAGNVPPAGWLLCDGGEYMRSSYPSLFAVIGVKFGHGDAITTFRVPDLRGRFLRGVDGSAGRDPDSATREAINAGGAVGNNVGSVQLDAFQDHRHDSTASTSMPSINITPNNAARVDTPTGFASSRNVADSTTTALESRPENMSVLWIIKT